MNSLDISVSTIPNTFYITVYVVNKYNPYSNNIKDCVSVYIVIELNFEANFRQYTNVNNNFNCVLCEIKCWAISI